MRYISLIYKLGLVLIIGVVLNSCTIQHQLSKKFLKQTDSISYLILKPTLVQKNSLAVQRLYPQFAQLSPDLQDTVWKHQTKFLDVIPDTTILNTYYNELILQLKKSGVHIYSEQEIDEFSKIIGEKSVFRIGQFQLEEDKKKVDFSEEVSNQEELYKDLEIQVLSINTWIEWFKRDADSIPSKVLYASKSISDEVNGRFFSTDNGNSYEFRYKRTDLSNSDVQNLLKSTASQNAQQLINFLFSQFVYRYYPESEKQFGFNIEKRSAYTPDENLKFIEIK